LPLGWLVGRGITPTRVRLIARTLRPFHRADHSPLFTPPPTPTDMFALLSSLGVVVSWRSFPFLSLDRIDLSLHLSPSPDKCGRRLWMDAAFFSPLSPMPVSTPTPIKKI